MMGLAKVNEDWVPLQTKVFSRWVSTQLKSFPNIEVNDIQKDLSNGVALIELATILTHKNPSRGWYENPKMKIEMVQNCELALDMFSKDGVSFVGISGKDISDNNTKLILGLVWTLILHYSVGHSINSDSILNKYSNQSNNKINQSTKDNKSSLLSWATERTEHYPNVHNFAPFDLSLCALLDSYFPNKVNYYSLNPENSENNAKLATKVMEEVGIPVYVYPEELQKTNNVVDEKTLLTQLSSAKIVLDEAEANKSTKSFEAAGTIETNDNDTQTQEEKHDSETDESETDTESESEEISELKETLASCQREIETLKQARDSSEREREQATFEITRIQGQYDIQKQQCQRVEAELEQEKIKNMENFAVIQELRETIHHMQRDFETIYNKNVSNVEEVKRLRCAWDMAQIEIENERNIREEVEYELQQLKSSISKKTTNIEEAENQYRFNSFINRIGQIQVDWNNKIELIEEKADRARQKLQILLLNISQNQSHETSQKSQSENSDDSEVERLRCAWDMGQIEIENEKNKLAEKEFELKNIKKTMNNETKNIEKAELKYRIPSFMKSIGDIQFQINHKIELMEMKIDDAQQKISFFKRELQYYKNQNEDLKLENKELTSRLEREEMKYRSTLAAYQDSIEAAIQEAHEQEEERKKADITIDHLMKQLNAHNN